MSLPINALTPRARRCLLQAATLAEDHGQAFIGTEHLLLALALDSGGRAAQVLDAIGARQSVFDELVAIIESYGPGGEASNPGGQVRVEFGSEPGSNHPLVVVP